MSFRYDRQHLTGQQQAIAAQRDRADEQTKKSSEKKETEILENEIITLLETSGLTLTLQEISKRITEKNEVKILKVLKGISSTIIESFVNPLDSENGTSTSYKAVKKAP